MKILEIKDIKRKQVPIYYRREFSGTAIFEVLKKNIASNMDFVIEQGPTGKSDIQISFKKHPEYPVLPLIKNIKNVIISMDKEGRLP